MGWKADVQTLSPVGHANSSLPMHLTQIKDSQSEPEH